MQHPSGTSLRYWPAPFFMVWGSQALGMITSETVQFALIWWLTRSTASASVVSMATLIALLPRAMAGPFLGALVDRWSRRRVLIASNLVIILALAGLGLLFKTGSVSIGAIDLIILICTCAKSFQMPAMLASTALMVPREHLSRVAGMNQMVQGIMRVAAPALGAVLVNALPMSAILVVDISGAGLCIAVLLVIALPNPSRSLVMESAASGWKALWMDVRAGVNYVRHWCGALEMLGISTAINFLSCPAFMLVSLMVTQRFGGTVQEFGVMSSAIGAGMIGGGILLSLWNGFRRPMQTSLAGIIGMGMALLLTGLAPRSLFWLASLGMFLGGFMIPVCMAPIQALIQKTVEAGMQGRVLTLLDSVSTIAAPLSLAIAGPLFDQFGPQTWYIGSGILCVAIGLLGFVMPRVLSLGMLLPDPGEAVI